MKWEEFTFGAIFIVCFVGVVVAGILFGFSDENGFKCPPGSQTVWEDDEYEIEGCILPGGKWMDDPT